MRELAEKKIFPKNGSECLTQFCGGSDSGVGTPND